MASREPNRQLCSVLVPKQSISIGVEIRFCLAWFDSLCYRQRIIPILIDTLLCHSAWELCLRRSANFSSLVVARLFFGRRTVRNAPICTRTGACFVIKHLVAKLARQFAYRTASHYRPQELEPPWHHPEPCRCQCGAISPFRHRRRCVASSQRTKRSPATHTHPDM